MTSDPHSLAIFPGVRSMLDVFNNSFPLIFFHISLNIQSTKMNYILTCTKVRSVSYRTQIFVSNFVEIWCSAHVRNFT